MAQENTRRETVETFFEIQLPWKRAEFIGESGQFGSEPEGRKKKVGNGVISLLNTNEPQTTRVMKRVCGVVEYQPRRHRINILQPTSPFMMFLPRINSVDVRLNDL